MTIIGIDPGMHDLIHAVGDYLNDPSKQLKYSAAQRRPRLLQKMQAENT